MWIARLLLPLLRSRACVAPRAATLSGRWAVCALIWALLPPHAAAGDRWQDYVERAEAACEARELDLAEDLLLDALREAEAIDGDGRRTRDTHHRLGLVHAARGAATLAEESFLRALGEGEDLSPLFGEPSARIAYLSSLAVLYENLGELGNAEARREQIVQLAELEGLHPELVAIAKANLARYRDRHGARAEAVAGHLEALSMLEAEPGRPELSAEQLEALGAIHKDAGRLVESEAAYRAALQIWSQLGEPTGFVFAKSLAGYADLLWRLDRRAEAIAALERAMALAELQWGIEAQHVADFGHSHTRFLRTLGAQVISSK